MTPGGADVEALDDLARRRRATRERPISPPRARRLRLAAAEQRVVDEARCRADGAVAVALLRHVAQAQRRAGPRGRGCRRAAVEADRVGRAGGARRTARPAARPGRCRPRRRCPGSRRARTSRLMSRNGMPCASAGGEREARDGEADLADAAAAGGAAGLAHLAADHQLGQAAGALLRAGRALPTTRPPRRMVARSHRRADLVELVADVEDRARPRPRAGAGSRTACRPPAGSAPRSARP